MTPYSSLYQIRRAQPVRCTHSLFYIFSFPPSVSQKDYWCLLTHFRNHSKWKIYNKTKELNKKPIKVISKNVLFWGSLLDVMKQQCQWCVFTKTTGKTVKGIIFSITIFNNLTIKWCILEPYSTIYQKVNLLEVPYRSFFESEHQSCSVFFWHMNKDFCSLYSFLEVICCSSWVPSHLF